MLETTRPVEVGTWTESAMTVLKERYLQRFPDGSQETPEDMCWRVARHIAEAERNFPLPKGIKKMDTHVHNIALAFYLHMLERKFMPNSPCLMNAGKANGLQYSACFVLPIEDHLEGIYDTLKYAALIHKSGGGTGFSFSRLRSKNAVIKTTGGFSSGPVSFLKVYDASTNEIKQGSTRRGANMAILRCDHPDIEDFITCKLTGGITNFNISVGITDTFMKKLEEDKEYDLVEPHSRMAVRRVSAKLIWSMIIKAAWQTGDPGVIFLDRINNSPANPVPELELIEATNPCGEQPLAPWDACTLGSINLGKFVNEKVIHWGELTRCVELSVRFLDNVLTMNPYPLREISDEVAANRRIGLGVMGWADMLIKMEIPYASQEALELATKVMSCINDTGHLKSEQLAETRGEFPNWSTSIYAKKKKIRNGTVTTIAPTGTISIIAGCSSGIEPLFSLAFTHETNGRRLEIFNEEVKKWFAMEEHQQATSLRQYVLNHGHFPSSKLDKGLDKIFPTAHDVPLEYHVKMQAAFQKHTDNGVSKTINLPAEATEGTVGRAYMMAWDLGCLGITVFRNGCKGAQVLNAGIKDKVMPIEMGADFTTEDHNKAKSENLTKVYGIGTYTGRYSQQATPELTKPLPRPGVLRGHTFQKRTAMGNCYITINELEEGEPFEVFAVLGKAGSDLAADAEAIGRLISMMLRSTPAGQRMKKLSEIEEQLRHIGGSQQIGMGPNRVSSIADAIAQAISSYVHPSTDQLKMEIPPTNGNKKVTLNMCPECGAAALAREGGCDNCKVCGYSKC